MSPSSSEVWISGGSTFRYHPTVGFLDGNWLIAWYRSASDTGHNVYGQRMAADATKVGSMITIASDTGTEYYSEVYGGPDYWFVTWTEPAVGNSENPGV